MVKASVKVISTIVAILVTIVGAWGAYFYRNSPMQWLQNLASDLFGAGALITSIFIILIITDYFD